MVSPVKVCRSGLSPWVVGTWEFSNICEWGEKKTSSRYVFDEETKSVPSRYAFFCSAFALPEVNTNPTYNFTVHRVCRENTETFTTRMQDFSAGLSTGLKRSDCDESRSGSMSAAAGAKSDST